MAVNEHDWASSRFASRFVSFEEERGRALPTGKTGWPEESQAGAIPDIFRLFLVDTRLFALTGLKRFILARTYVIFSWL